MRTRETVLRVVHRGEAKMVGKVFWVDSSCVLLHEESGTQKLARYDGIGIDAIAVAWCLKQGVHEYHHRVKGKGGALSIPMDRIPLKGQRKTFGGRDRYIVPFDSFLDLGHTSYRVPWISKEIVLTADDVDLSSLPCPPRHEEATNVTQPALL